MPFKFCDRRIFELGNVKSAYAKFDSDIIHGMIHGLISFIFYTENVFAGFTTSEFQLVADNFKLTIQPC